MDVPSKDAHSSKWRSGAHKGAHVGCSSCSVPCRRRFLSWRFLQLFTRVLPRIMPITTVNGRPLSSSNRGKQQTTVEENIAQSRRKAPTVLSSKSVLQIMRMDSHLLHSCAIRAFRCYRIVANRRKYRENSSVVFEE